RSLIITDQNGTLYNAIYETSDYVLIINSIIPFPNPIVATNSQADISGILTAACDSNGSVYYLQQGNVISSNVLTTNIQPVQCAEDERFIYVVGQNTT